MNEPLFNEIVEGEEVIEKFNANDTRVITYLLTTILKQLMILNETLINIQYKIKGEY